MVSERSTVMMQQLGVVTGVKCRQQGHCEITKYRGYVEAKVLQMSS